MSLVFWYLFLVATALVTGCDRISESLRPKVTILQGIYTPVKGCDGLVEGVLVRAPCEDFGKYAGKMLEVKGQVVENKCDPEEVQCFSGPVMKRVDSISLVVSSLEISEVLLDRKEGYNHLTFFFYLERSDLRIKEPSTHGLVADLAPPLRSQWIMATSDPQQPDPEKGSTCDATRFPHKCTIGLTDGELIDSYQTVLIRVVFEDGHQEMKRLIVPRPPLLDRPEIVEPTIPPYQESPLKIRFRDVGAYSYDIGVQFCGHSQEGLNPCREGTEYFLERRGEGLFFPQNYPRFPPRVTVNSGVITVQSDLPFHFDSELRVQIEAGRVTRVKEGVRMVSRSSSVRSLRR